MSLHCPLTPATRGLMDAGRLAQMKPGALLVNTSRGPLVDEAAVADALRSEFEEQPVTHRADGTQLWGSDLMGTWTVVLGRADGTQCIIASGIGYQDGTDPLAFYAKVDLA